MSDYKEVAARLRDDFLARYPDTRRQAADLIEQQAARIAELEAEADDSDKLRNRMAQLLTGVANALRGQPPNLTSWSWHDLPERAAAAIRAIAVMEAAARDSARMVAELEAATRWRPMSEKPDDESDPVIAVDGDGIIVPAYWSGGKLYVVDQWDDIPFVAWLPIQPFEEPKP